MKNIGKTFTLYNIDDSVLISFVIKHEKCEMSELNEIHSVSENGFSWYQYTGNYDKIN